MSKWLKDGFDCYKGYLSCWQFYVINFLIGVYIINV